MRTKNLSILSFGTAVTSTSPPQPEMVLIVRGRFDMVQGATAQAPACEPGLEPIVQGPLTGDGYAEDDDERKGQLTYASDFAPMKPRAEVLFVGHCHPAGGRAVTECTASIQVGSWRKALRIVGPRRFEGVTGDSPGPPKAFRKLSLDWTRSAGGPTSTLNPVGVGELGDLVPCIEAPDAPVTRRGRGLVPAGFGPISPDWSPRRTRLGTAYGESYRPRAPYFAEDFQWSYFNAAPEDQWLARPLRGDEWVELENLHPEHEVLRTQLPGLRVRCFVNDVQGTLREVAMVLDTLWIDGDEQQLLLTWRGRTEVADDELEDVTTVLVVSEPLDEPPQPAELYHARLRKFEADPQALDENLTGEELELLKAGRRKEGVGEALVKLIERESPGMTETLAKGPDGGIDLAAAVDEAIAKDDDVPPPVPHPAAPRTHLGIDLGDIERALPELEAHAPEEAARLKERLSDPRLLALDPNYRPPGSPAQAPEPPLEPGVDLSGRDLSDRDLSGADLSGSNLSGAILARTKLRGTNLSGAKLEGVLLFKADLTDANLSGAVLERVNAAKADLTRADLSHASLEAAFFAEATGEGARFDGTRGTHVFFTKAVLPGVSFRGAHLTRADCESAQLPGADFRDAHLDACLFYLAELPKAVFEDAEVPGCSFEGATLTETKLIGMTGDTVNFTGCQLDDADIRHAQLPSAHFTKVDATGARFDAADLTGARFFKSVLTRATFKQAKLVSADLSKTTLDGTSFDGANLYDAKLLKALGHRTSFEGANTKRVQR